MFVVMTVGASEAEIIGVKSRILAEGLTPFDHVGPERTAALLREYWSIPERQIETSVVLAKPALD